MDIEAIFKWPHTSLHIFDRKLAEMFKYNFVLLCLLPAQVFYDSNTTVFNYMKMFTPKMNLIHKDRYKEKTNKL